MQLSNFTLMLVVLSVLVGAQYIQAWTAAPGNPPAGNVAAPINTGGTDQTKNAGLILQKGLVADGLAIKFLNTSAGNATTYWRMRRNDGTGNHLQYWNTIGGTTPVRETAGFAFRQSYDPGNGNFKFQTSEFTGAANAAIAWKDALTIGGDGSVTINNLTTGGGALPTCPAGSVPVSQTNGSWACGDAMPTTCAQGEVAVSNGNGTWGCGPNFEQCHKFVSQYGGSVPVVSFVNGATNVTHIAMIGNYNSGYGTYDQFLWTGYWQNDFHSWGYFVGRTNTYVSSNLISLNTWANVSNRQPRTITMIGPNSVQMTLSYSYGSCH